MTVKISRRAKRTQILERITEILQREMPECRTVLYRLGPTGKDNPNFYVTRVQWDDTDDYMAISASYSSK